MKRGLLKKAACGVTATTLLFSTAFPSMAASAGVDDYIFSLVLCACGYLPSHLYIGQWKESYKWYLESTGNTAVLNQLRSYSNLSSGDTASGVLELYNSMKDWASLIKQDSSGSLAYILPASPSSQTTDFSTLDRFARIVTSPFSDCNALPEISDYEYLFSYTYLTDTQYVRQNVYKPKGVEVLGYVSGCQSYDDNIRVSFVKRDTSSSTGYSDVILKRMNLAYSRSTGSLVAKSTTSLDLSALSPLRVRSVMNFPFHVFSHNAFISDYVKTGIPNGSFDNGIASRFYKDAKGSNLLVQSLDGLIRDTLVVPDASTVSSFGNVLELSSWAPEDVSSFLAGYGLDVSYFADYVVEHYTQDSLGSDWVKTDTEILSGTVGQDAEYTEKKYDGLKFNDSLTELDNGKIKGDGSLTIKLYYEAYELPYTVEYYKDGDKFKTIDSTVSSLSPQVLSVPSYLPPGFKLDRASSPQFPYPVEGENTVIKVYYITDEKSPVTVSKKNFKHIAQELVKIIFCLIPAICALIALIILIRIVLKLFRQTFKSRK